jgi:uncharacterized membrane protein HdeD (DUF308 family)
MKNFKNWFLFIIAALLVMAAPAFGQDTESTSTTVSVITVLPALLLAVMAVIKIIVNLTPTEKDNKIFGFFDDFFNSFVPNYKKGGGKF